MCVCANAEEVVVADTWSVSFINWKCIINNRNVLKAAFMHKKAAAATATTQRSNGNSYLFWLNCWKVVCALLNKVNSGKWKVHGEQWKDLVRVLQLLLADDMEWDGWLWWKWHFVVAAATARKCWKMSGCLNVCFLFVFYCSSLCLCTVRLHQAIVWIAPMLRKSEHNRVNTQTLTWRPKKMHYRMHCRTI